MSDTTIVIGAGAAGLACARALQDAGADVTLVEARDRLGGRAWTSYDIAPHPVELGAEYVHGENVLTWEYINRYGFNTNDQTTVMNLYGVLDGKLAPAGDMLRTTGMAMALSTHAAAHDAKPGDTLVDAMRTWVAAQGRTATDDDWAIWRSFTRQYFAADPEQIGAAEFGEPTFDGDGTRLQFRILEGYSALWQRMAEGIDIRLSTPVTRVRWSSDGVQVETPAASIEGRRAVIALPVSLLQRETIAFDPPLPQEKTRAINAIGAGVNGKIVFHFDHMPWPDDLTLLLTGEDTQLWWRPGRLREDEAPVITAFFGGSSVGRFRALGDDAPTAALSVLEGALGKKLGASLVSARFVDWEADPWAGMSYSYLPVGGAGMRARLAEPIDGTLFFVGEASSAVRPSCVHGALDTGRRAASEIVAASA